MAAESGGSKKPPRSTRATPKTPTKRTTAPAGKSTKAGATADKSATASTRKPAGKAPAMSPRSASRAAAKPAKAASKPKPKPKPKRADAAKPAKVTATKPAEAPAAALVEETARRYFAALADRDPVAAARAWNSDGVHDVVPLGIFRGPAAIRAFFDEMFAAMPDVRFSVERIVADDASAAVQWRAAGTFSGAPFQGLEANGRRVDLRGIDCLEIVDGNIVHGTGVFDGAAFARQIRLLPPEDSGADRAIRAGFNAVTKLRRSVERRTAG